MAMKRCPDCGEKYSDSYKYCPFCEEEEILKEGKGRGSRRARQSKGFSVLTPVLIVLIIVMAGLLMYLLKSDKQPTEPVTPGGVVTPVTPGTDNAAPDDQEEPDDNTDPGVMPDEPDTEPAEPDTNTGSGGNTNTGTNTSAAGGEATIVNAATGVNVRPDASTSGTPIASLKNGDKVQVVRDAGNGWYEITFSGPGGRDTTGYVKGDFLSTTAGSSATTTTPSTTTNTSTSSTSTSTGSLKTGSAKVTNAAGGVNVRPGPSTSGAPVASLKNGDAVQIVRSAEDGWYEITFTGSGGKDTTGYMKGDYLTNG